jgi:two-component system response regulator GlrR
MESRKRILIVDDDEAVLFILRETFSKLGEGYQVVSSRSGREAMEQLAREPCDVIVTDLKMPDIDGVRLTEAVRSTSPGIPVIWLTAYGCEGVQEELARLKVRRCINKPVRTSEIVRAVRECLENSQASGSGEPARDGERDKLS